MGIVKRLKKYRSDELSKLKKKHRNEIKSLLERAETSTNPEGFLNSVHSVLKKQSEEIGDYWSSADKDEASKLKNAHLVRKGPFSELTVFRD